jgi:hypothetical protein
VFAWPLGRLVPVSNGESLCQLATQIVNVEEYGIMGSWPWIRLLSLACKFQLVYDISILT